MNKNQAEKFLKRAIQQDDTIIFQIYSSEINEKTLEFVCRMHCGLIEIGPEVAIFLDGLVNQNNYAYSLQEKENKKIVMNAMPLTILMILGKQLFDNEFALRIENEYV